MYQLLSLVFFQLVSNLSNNLMNPVPGLCARCGGCVKSRLRSKSATLCPKGEREREKSVRIRLRRHLSLCSGNCEGGDNLKFSDHT
jgi:hypothetical protein